MRKKKQIYNVFSVHFHMTFSTLNLRFSLTLRNHCKPGH